MLNCLPGQKEIESSVKKVKSAAQKLDNAQLMQPRGNFKDAAQNLKVGTNFILFQKSCQNSQYSY